MHFHVSSFTLFTVDIMLLEFTGDYTIPIYCKHANM